MRDFYGFLSGVFVVVVVLAIVSWMRSPRDFRGRYVMQCHTLNHATVLDTQTGELWYVLDANSPKDRSVTRIELPR